MIAALASAVVLAAPQFEARAVWVDATANLAWTIDPVKVAEFVGNAKRVGFNEIIVDVKPINGKVLFEGSPAERFTTFRDVRLPVGYDTLEVFSRECRRQGIRICAALNVFSEGHSYFPGVGLAFDRPDWHTKVAVARYYLRLDDGTEVPLLTDPRAPARQGWAQLADEGTPIPGTELKVKGIGDRAILSWRWSTQIVPQLEAYPEMVAVFVDPLAPGVRSRMLDYVRRVAKYDIDGIVFDRLRYSALDSGMGPEMRAAFERKYGGVAAWPESVFYASPTIGPLRRGPRFAQWMQFRAEVIQEFLAEALQVAKTENPDLTLGSYVGAGWETYFDVGVNYATDEPRAHYSWAAEEYGLAGYAGFLDYLMTGCFYRIAAEIDPGVSPGRERFTVEGGAKLTATLAERSTYVLPSLYGLDWEGNEQGLRNAIAACRKYGSGLMFFDAIYILRNNWWSVFEEEFRGAPTQAPYALPSLRKAKPIRGETFPSFRRSL